MQSPTKSCSKSAKSIPSLHVSKSIQVSKSKSTKPSYSTSYSPDEDRERLSVPYRIRAFSEPSCAMCQVLQSRGRDLKLGSSRGLERSISQYDSVSEIHSRLSSSFSSRLNSKFDLANMQKKLSPLPPRPQRKDSGYAWVVLIAAFFCQLISLGVTYSVGVLTVAFLSEFKQGTYETAWVASINTGFSVGAGPLAAWLVTTFDHQTTVVIGGLLSTVGIALSTLATELWVLYITFGAMAGTGFCLVYLPSATIIPEYFHTKQTFAFGLITAGSGVGNLIMAPLLQLLLDNLSLTLTFFALAGICFLQMMLGLLLRPPPVNIPESFSIVDCEPAIRPTTPSIAQSCSLSIYSVTAEDNNSHSRRDSRRHSLRLTSPDSGSHRNSSGFTEDEATLRSSADLLESVREERRQRSGLCGLLSEWRTWVFAISSGSYQAGANCVFILISDFAMKSPAELSSTEGTVLITVIGVAMLIGEMLPSIIGYFIDDFGKLIPYAITPVIYGVVTILFPFMTSYETLIVGCFVFGMAFGAQMSLVLPLVSDLFGEDRLSHALGFSLLIQGIGLIGGPPLAGLIEESQGYVASFHAAGGLILLSVPAILLLGLGQRCRLKPCSGSLA